YGHAILDRKGALKIDLLEENTGVLYQPPLFVQRQIRRRIQPHFAFEQSDSFVSWRELEHVHIFAHNPSLPAKFEFVVYWGNRQILVSLTVLFGLKITRNHLILNGVVTLEPKNTVCDLAYFGHLPQHAQPPLLLQFWNRCADLHLHRGIYRFSRSVLSGA